MQTIAKITSFYFKPISRHSHSNTACAHRRFQGASRAVATPKDAEG